MQKFFLCMLLAFVGFGLVVSDASAGRFGGRGFSMMRSKSMYTHSPRAKQTTGTAARQGNSNRWRGALTGLLMGSLLTSLFMGHGFGSGLLSWLIVGGALYFIVNVLRRRRREDLR